MKSEIRLLHLNISLLNYQIYRSGNRSPEDKIRLNREINFRYDLLKSKIGEIGHNKK